MWGCLSFASGGDRALLLGLEFDFMLEVRRSSIMDFAVGQRRELKESDY